MNTPDDPTVQQESLFVRSLLHQSHFVLQTRGLSSGLSRDVDGQLSLGRGALVSREHPFLPQLLQYKLQDGGVKFFGKGLSFQ